MKTKTQIKAGRVVANHNETLVRDNAKAKGLKVKSQVKAGRIITNHNETLMRDRAKGLKAKS